MQTQQHIKCTKPIPVYITSLPIPLPSRHSILYILAVVIAEKFVAEPTVPTQNEQKQTISSNRLRYSEQYKTVNMDKEEKNGTAIKKSARSTRRKTLKNKTIDPALSSIRAEHDVDRSKLL